jgi:integrase
MASISTDPNGRRRILFVSGSGKRQTIRLGVMQQRHAEAVRLKVESLLSAAHSGQPPDQATAAWIAAIPDLLHERIAATGLIKPRQGRTLGQWLAAFMTSRADLKPESRRKLEQTKLKLERHFGADRPLHTISAEDATAWREALRTEGLSEASIKIHSGNVKTMIGEAVRREILARSPFAHLKGGVTPTSNTRYVTPAETERLLAAAPNAEWRLIIGLARLAGLRTPSEVEKLTWAAVDWERGRLRVQSPKTERFAGHAVRTVPISPRLMPLLRARLAERTEGEDRLLTITSIDSRTRFMRRLMAKANVEPWDDLWQTLRRSCEIEWAQTYPQYAVSRWIGHSITVSGRHYVNAIPDELFDRVAGRPASPQATEAAVPNPAPAVETPKATQNPAQHGAAGTRLGSHRAGPNLRPNTRKSLSFKDLRDDASLFDFAPEWSRGESNPRAGAVRRKPLRA